MQPDRTSELSSLLQQRLLVLDGAMGTMIQRHGLQEADYRGARFADHRHDLKGNNDLLVLTRPDIIGGIHREYLEAGADILETCTFNSTAVSQADYNLSELVYELNFEGAKLARLLCDEFTAQNPAKPRFVAGVLGPTSRTASISPDVNDPGYRNVTFDALVTDYIEAIRGLTDGGADILLVETVFDTLNAKAALFAIEQFFDASGRRWPVMISGTITDASGRTLSGQTAEAFWNSLRHVQPLSFGLNCALGAKELRQYVEELARVCDCYVSAHPNAGLPNAFGEYDETPAQMAEVVEEFAASGLLNIIGGCCGTTPPHIQAIAEAVAKYPPRVIPDIPKACRLSGLEPFTIDRNSLFVNVGERTNITGSATSNAPHEPTVIIDDRTTLNQTNHVSDQSNNPTNKENTMDTGMHMHHTAPADGETATDPVCGMTVAVNADAITREYEGKSYYFCGEHCATNFMKAPQVFLEQ